MLKQSIILVTLIGGAYANQIESNITIKDIHGTVESGSWVNMRIEQSIKALPGTTLYKAKTTDNIYNQNFSEILIPTGSIINGIYHNNGNSCYFEVQNINVNGRKIAVESTDYTLINAPLPNQTPCNPKLDYEKHQLLEFQTLVDFKNLDVIAVTQIKKATQPNELVQAFGNQQYYITKITQLENGLQSINVRVNDKAFNVNNLVPIWFDDYGLAHGLNYFRVYDSNGNVNYLTLSHYERFGLGVIK